MGAGEGGLWRKWDGFFLLVSNTLYFFSSFFPVGFFYQEYFLFFLYTSILAGGAGIDGWGRVGQER